MPGHRKGFVLLDQPLSPERGQQRHGAIIVKGKKWPGMGIEGRKPHPEGHEARQKPKEGRCLHSQTLLTTTLPFTLNIFLQLVVNYVSGFPLD